MPADPKPKKKNQNIQDCLRDLDVYGYVKIENFLNKKQVNNLLSLVNHEYERLNSVKKIQYNGVPKRDKYDKILYNLFNVDYDFIKLLNQNLIKEIAMNRLNDPYYKFLPKNKPNYCLSYYNARSSGKKLDLHIDSHMPYLSDRIIAMQFVFLLEESSVENGCSTAVPGSHKSGRFTDRSLTELSNLTGSPGDLVIWDSRLWHGTNENISKKSRWALIATLSPWWIKPGVDVVRSVKKNIYNQCKDEEKRLLGFCSIPPTDIFERINTKTGYDFLKSNLDNYKFI